MTQMTALKPFKYAGRMLAVSEEFSVKGKSEARLLKAMKFATEAKKPERVAAIFKKAEIEEDKPKRKYLRRDMTAE